MKRHHKTDGRTKYPVRGAAVLGVILLLLVAMVSGRYEAISTRDLAGKTMDTVRQQCVSFDKLVAADCTKSLFRMVDLIKILRADLKEDPSHIRDSYLEAYSNRLRLTGVAVLDGDLKLEASGYTRNFMNNDWMTGDNRTQLQEIINYPSKVYTRRVEYSGIYYDLCGMARQDADGVIIGYYQQPTGMISGTQTDLESLLTGLNVEDDGRYVIVEDGVVRATSDADLKDLTVSSNPLLRKMFSVAGDEKLHMISVQRQFYWVYRSSCEGYSLGIVYPVFQTFSNTIVAVALFVAFYLFLCALYFGVRNRALQENQEKLQQTNARLSQSVKSLKALETLYFSIFYVSLEDDRYETIYMPSWLQELAPRQGTYSSMWRSFLDATVVAEYREELDGKMSCRYIEQALSSENLTDVRKSYYIDFQAVRDETKKWCRATATTVDQREDGRPQHVLVMLQDVDVEKAKEAAYQERILKEAQDARVANMAKTEFLRRISHDIRTPINGIQGYLELANTHPEDLELQEHCRESSKAALHTLLELVSSVLEMSKLESDEIVLEEKPFDLARLVSEADTILKPQAAAKQIRYEIMRSEELKYTHVLGSPRHVSQILMNIAVNAVKYTRPGGYLHLDTRMVDVDEKRVVYEFMCEDNGIGMSEEFQKHMFETFTQENQDSARTTYQGSGLGLSIVKRLVDALGGTIRCESHKDVGTTFWIQIPFLLDPQYQNPSVEQEGVDRPLEGKKILLAEDNELNMEVARYLLEDQGAQVDVAWDGQEAVERFAASQPFAYDIVFLDIMMPRMDGLEAARQIRAMDREDAAGVLILAMSANAFADDVKRSREAGISAHIAKPIDMEKILSAVRHFLPAASDNLAKDSHTI